MLSSVSRSKKIRSCYCVHLLTAGIFYKFGGVVSGGTHRDNPVSKLIARIVSLTFLSRFSYPKRQTSLKPLQKISRGNKCIDLNNNNCKGLRSPTCTCILIFKILLFDMGDRNH